MQAEAIPQNNWNNSEFELVGHNVYLLPSGEEVSGATGVHLGDHGASHILYMQQRRRTYLSLGPGQGWSF